MAWLGIWFGISNTCGVWSNWVGRNRKTGEEHDKDCVQDMLRKTDSFWDGVL